jgi:hypothetical protein
MPHIRRFYMTISPGKFLLSAFLLTALLCPSSDAFATGETKTNKTTTEIKAGEAKYIYERPSRQKFSRLYWALGMLDLKEDKSVDDFLQINECDIYKDYYYNEFEWKNVRESGRQFLAENMNKFPLRFEVVQPLLLGEYDLQTESFEILPDYQIKETSRIEVFPQDYADIVCQDDGSGRIQQIENYPIGVVAEFNRPLNLVTVPVPDALARAYIEEKLATFKKLRADRQNQENLYNFRDAYIFMHMKFFAYKDQFTNNENYRMAEIMAVLEGFEIYADKEKKMLLWSQDFRKKKSKPTKKQPVDEYNKDQPEEVDEDPGTDPTTATTPPADEAPATPPVDSFNPATPGSGAPQPTGESPF